jgi:hypothetical protein
LFDRRVSFKVVSHERTAQLVPVGYATTKWAKYILRNRIEEREFIFDRLPVHFAVNIFEMEILYPFMMPYVKRNCVNSSVRHVSRVDANTHFDRWDAYMLLTECGIVRLGNFVDPKYSVGASASKNYL